MNAKKILLGIVLVASFASAANDSAFVIKNGLLVTQKNRFGIKTYINLKEVEMITVKDYPINKKYKIITLHFANKNDNYQILDTKEALNKIINFLTKK